MKKFKENKISTANRITIKPIADRIRIWLENKMNDYKGDLDGMCVAGKISHDFEKEFINKRGKEK